MVRQNGRVRIERAVPATGDGLDLELGELLVDAVDGGASVGFLEALDVATAADWWHGALRTPDTLTWVARDTDGTAVGVVQLGLVTLPNGSHRGSVHKLLVHRRARGRGIASRLMDVVEAAAVDNGRWLLMLDTETGSPAEGFYERRGWQQLGVLRDHARCPDGRLAPTTFFTKRLAGAPPL